MPPRSAAEGSIFSGTGDAIWFKAGNVEVNFSLRADGLTAIMLVMVTFIGSLIAIYAAGYMHGDPGYPRFFAEVSLFLFFMTGLVLANNFILLYACWEGVGLCSYLLIGFWYARPSAAAARKAFLVTRLGDIGLFIGILLLMAQLRPIPRVRGYLRQREGQAGCRHALDQYQNAAVLGVRLPMFIGTAGKSGAVPAACLGCPTRWKVPRP